RKRLGFFVDGIAIGTEQYAIKFNRQDRLLGDNDRYYQRIRYPLPSVIDLEIINEYRSRTFDGALPPLAQACDVYDLNQIDYGTLEDRHSRERLKSLLSKYEPAFATNEFDVGLIEDSEFQIELKPDSRGFQMKPRRMSAVDDADCFRQMQCLFRIGVWEEITHSPWISNVVTARKKNGD
ncbi:MAG: hypothetical protein GY826_37160, partial [Fuerstiella sp.]|nr:hypothetical protein [Fuerstiella sp.]